MTASSPPPARGVTLSPPTLVFAATMLILGGVTGWLLGRGPPPPPWAPEPTTLPRVAPPIAEKDQPPPTLPAERDPGPPPADSPFMAPSILAKFSDPELRTLYARSVAFLAQGDARGGLRGLVHLEDASVGEPWREEAMTLVIDGRARSGEVGAPRHLLAEFRREFPDPQYPATLWIAEARTWLTQRARIRRDRGGKTVAQQKAEALKRAQELLAKAVAADPDGPAGREARALRGGG